ncbi:MAG: hypothetical protein AAF438_17400, partial [Pseudomonadota bacterium]
SDNELSKIQLVENQVGIALVEGGEAKAAEAHGRITIWNDPTRAFHCALSFAYLREKSQDPLIRLLDSLVFEAWQTKNTAAYTLD